MYDIVLTDRAYVPVGVIKEASNIQYFRGLGKLATLVFQVPMAHPHIERLSTADGYFKVYRSGVLLYVGPIITAEENAEREARTLTVTSADAGWFLGKRIAGRSETGTIWATATARHVIAKALVDAANTDGETGVSTADYVFTSGSSITYKAGPYAPLLPLLQDLGGALDGFDWFVRPKENWANGASTGAKIGSLQVATLIGSVKSDAVFDYGAGTRSNVLSYSKSTTREQQANTVYHAGSTPSNVVTGTNAGAITTWGLLADVVTGEFTDATMRQSLVDDHVAVRGNPRTLIRMTPHIDPGVVGRVPEPFVEYDIGDTITFHAVDAGVVRFSGNLRVYGIRASIDASGFERVELVLEDE